MGPGETTTLQTGTYRISPGPRWLSISLIPLLILLFGVLTACTDDDSDAATNGSEPAETVEPANDESGQEAAVDTGDTLQVVVTLPFMPSMVDAVGGDYIVSESIVPSGVDAHTYQPTPGNARLIADADVIFVNGLGLEEFLEKLIESAGGVDAPVYEMAEGLQQEALHEDDDHHHDDHHDDHDHHLEFGNPHLWLNPLFGVTYVENIYEGLSEIDPANEAIYRSNADEYIAELESIDEWAQEQLDQIPAENRAMVTFHDAFPYFADQYGLDIIGVIVSSPGREPGAREMADLVDQIRDAGVSVVFIEPQFNPALAEAIASEADVSTVVIYSDAPPDDLGYLEMLRTNVERVVEGLS